ncbi:MAG: PH domain-containing protein [Oscillospiraceae bacterium]|nr:PH domain-containing protein [Oscillospiraceae bacterium]
MANRYIWKDRKRFLGMPLSFTRYAISEDRLFLSIGFWSIRDEEVLLYRVRDISSSRSMWQRLFGVGTVTVTSSDKTTPTIVMKNIKNPIEVKELLHAQVEEMKLRRRVRVGEIMTAGMEDDDSDLDDP